MLSTKWLKKYCENIVKKEFNKGLFMKKKDEKDLGKANKC